MKMNKGDEPGSNNYISEGIPFIKTSDFQNFGVDYQPDNYCSESMYDELKQDLQKGDILFTKDGKIGEVAVIDESKKIVYSSGIMRIRPNNVFERYWIFLILSSTYGKVFFTQYTVIASTMAHLRKDFFSDYKIPTPTKSQKCYVNELKTIFDNKIIAFDKINKSKKIILSFIDDIIDDN